MLRRERCAANREQPREKMGRYQIHGNDPAKERRRDPRSKLRKTASCSAILRVWKLSPFKRVVCDVIGLLTDIAYKTRLILFLVTTKGVIDLTYSTITLVTLSR
jgi:hypothetical protein